MVALEREGLRRRPAEPLDPYATSFCSNDYLGLASLASPPSPSGAGASRLIAGEREEHRRAERAFATFLGVEDVLLFTSGYAANVGVLSALAGPDDLLVSDALNHASLIDGARLSRAKVCVVPHLDLGQVERVLRERPPGQRAWVVLESYYSMDADSPDLGRARAVCDAHGAALVVDEAHALGVLGPEGRGLLAEAGVRADVVVGTLGKAFGAQGAFVGGSTVLREWLWNRARSFVFSTGLAPSSAAAATRSLQHVLEHPEERARVLELAAWLRGELLRRGARPWQPDLVTASGPPAIAGHGHVVPLVVGTEARALALAEGVRARGIVVQAIRPPTVPSGTARIRLTLTAKHTRDDVERAAVAIAEAMRELRDAPVDPAARTEGAP
ncbi:MAG: 8-amino-7-oxononanoate synthase [Deltaproteobacteria bacterium]|nr:8-amino-7-oxononanoate synthase [Deltaproteobacteria bacterium]